MLDNLFSAFCAALLGIAMLISVPQIVGTWQSGHVVLQIFADGHYEVDTNGDTVSDIYGGYLLSPHNDHPPVLAVLDTGGGQHVPVWRDRLLLGREGQQRGSPPHGNAGPLRRSQRDAIESMEAATPT